MGDGRYCFLGRGARGVLGGDLGVYIGDQVSGSSFTFIFCILFYPFYPFFFYLPSRPAVRGLWLGEGYRERSCMAWLSITDSI